MRKQFNTWFSLLGLWFFASCFDGSGEYSVYSYDISSLSGRWAGVLDCHISGGIYDGLDTSQNMVFTFDSGGSLICAEGTECTGQLNVTGLGLISGTIVYTHYRPDYGMETVYEDWSGAYFRDVDIIDLQMVWTFETTDPWAVGTYTLSGTLQK